MQKYFFILLLLSFGIPVSQAENKDSGTDSLISLLTGEITVNQALLLNETGDRFISDFPDSAIFYYIKASNTAKETGVDSIYANSVLNLGLAESNRENYRKALIYLKEALDLYAKLNKQEGIAKSSQNLGLVEYYLGNYEDAVKNYQRALRIYERAKNDQEFADVLQNIGLVHHELENIDDALKYYNKSLEINLNLGNRENIAALTQNIGLLYIKGSDLKKALENITRSLKNYEELGDDFGIAVTLSNIGLIYQNEKKFREASEYYHKSLLVFDSIGNKIGKLWALHNVGTTYSDIKDYTSALDYFNKSLEISNETGHIEGLISNYEAISNLYTDTRDYKKSLEYYKKYKSVGDSINSLESKEKISELEAYYELELVNKELAAEKQKIIQNKRQRMVLFAGFILMLGLLITIAIAYSQKSRVETELIGNKRMLENLVEQRTWQLNSEINERKVAEKSDRLKSAFLSNMSHELRTPLNAIIAFSNMIRDTTLTAEKKIEYINYITAAGESLLNLVDDIIDIAKIEAKQVTLNYSKFDITRLCNELLNIFEEIKKKKGKNYLQLILDRSCLKESIIITSDPQRIKQILSNLLENSLKYTSTGFVEFGFTKRNGSIEFYVKDSGIGIPEEKFNYIFERFSQLDYSTNKEFGGTGLGLAICKNLVKLLGGKIWLESKENVGSTFYFTVPYTEIEIKPYSQVNEVKKIVTQGFFSHFNWQGKTILIAEDEELNYKVLESALSMTGVKIFRARNGFEAIRKFTDFKVDLVLMDIQMPKMDGYTATKEIKKINNTIPVIAQTSFAMEGEKEKCILAGCDNYLSKPLNLSELLELIEKYFHEYSGVSV